MLSKRLPRRSPERLPREKGLSPVTGDTALSVCLFLSPSFGDPILSPPAMSPTPQNRDLRMHMKGQSATQNVTSWKVNWNSLHRCLSDSNSHFYCLICVDLFIGCAFALPSVLSRPVISTTAAPCYQGELPPVWEFGVDV